MVCISQDSFYRELNPAESIKASKGLFNFDHPGLFHSWRFQTAFIVKCLFYTTANKFLLLCISDAFDNQLILKTLQDILDGRVCKIPVYDFKTNSRCEKLEIFE